MIAWVSSLALFAYAGVVVSNGWHWFAEPHGAPYLPLTHVMGAMLVARMAAGRLGVTEQLRRRHDGATDPSEALSFFAHAFAYGYIHAVMWALHLLGGAA